jgi:hypothetical protein
MPHTSRTDFPADSEQRGGRRKPMLAAGLIAQSDGGNPQECTIRDYGPRGVRVGLPEHSGALPQLLYLVNLRERMAHEANVAWRTNAEAGLAIRRSWPLSDTTNPVIALLKKLWFSRVSR